ncbi:MAG TPA: phenylalanine--tRNA ligase subunit beta [Thermoanaerobaculia bacterium]|jgi:phenylalanyl-tRNA synthetase beta chain|nr:phenylalanine--tRNA ligase subunit beta [Thermoanaerobaculia bacterium]
MRFSCDWLARYVDLPDPVELSLLLTSAGLAVEQIEKIESQLGDDTILDIEVTTNRPDAMCHVGLAREIATILDRPLLRPLVAPEAGGASGVATTDLVSVEIAEPDLCPRFVGRVVRGVKIGPSPDWLRLALESIGLRSISNVVDVTNFVLWELGQPLHAYDLGKLGGGKIVVRRALPRERIKTLDGVERALDPEILVIADAEVPVGVGGVMGGFDSEVTAETVDLLIEGAHFDRAAVRRASRTLNLKTDASHRFERGADLEGCRFAVDRAALLIAEIAGGEVLAGAVDVRPGRRLPRRGRLEHGKLEAFAGARIAPESVERWLKGLGFSPRPAGTESGVGEAWEVEVPSWRYFDFAPRAAEEDAVFEEIYPADLYEEILRLHGFDPVAPTLPALSGADAPKNPVLARRARIQDRLAACGLAETVQYSFIDPQDEAKLPLLAPEGVAVPLVNPLSERLAVMRRSLLPGLVETARFNKRRGAAAVRLFEVARVFYRTAGQAPGDGSLPRQPERIAIVLGGRVGTPWEHQIEIDFFDLKGAIESLATEFGVTLAFRAAAPRGLVPGLAAEILLGDRVVGVIGRLAGEEGYPLFVAELEADALQPEPEGFLLRGGAADAKSAADASAAIAGLGVEAPSRFPGVAADATITHALSVNWEQIAAAIRELAPADLVDHGLKDRYRGQGVPDGAVNTTIYFLYNAGDRSLTQTEVNERQVELVRALESRFGWKG